MADVGRTGHSPRRARPDGEAEAGPTGGTAAEGAAIDSRKKGGVRRAHDRERGSRPAPAAASRAALVGLCLLEFLSWGVLYYSLPVGATRIAAENSWPPAVVPGVYEPPRTRS